ncbi:MAG: PKD domain-containing protein [Balneolaceae bacterium]
MGNRLHTYVRMSLAFICLTFLFSSFVFAQNVNFRVMTYNGLKLDGTDTDRQAAFQTVLQAANPDILLMQEIVDAAGADLILSALNAAGNQYSRATFINGTDTDNMLFYRNSIGTLTSQTEIPTALREISEYVMQIGSNEIRFYSAHLKASSGSSNETLREAEVTILRNHLNNLPAGTEFVIVGDFNLYDSNEPAYQKFIANEADNDGRAEDPLAASGGVGDWHINPAFASVHTQSPRTTQFGGGANGGLDDRFDFILTSFGINDNAKVDMIPGTYTAFGNDGNHFDTSLIDGPNSVVSAAVAQAIHDASDHLPVYADFVSLGSGGGNIPPVANANGPYNGTTTGPVNFSSAGSSDSDGTITSYSWTFGDGNSSTLANPSHTYAADGSYSVSLTVTDNGGATSNDVTTATISTGSGSGAVVFSEVFYDTPGTDSQEEWIELYNGTSNSVDLSNWTITDNNGTGSTFTIPGGTTISSGTYLTIAVNSTGFNALYSFDADVYGSIPALNNSGDALLLNDATSTLIDAVAWEGGASSGVPSGWGSSSSPSAPTGSSITRTNVTTDTDTFSDWSVVSGNGNPQVQPTNAAPVAVANGPYAGNTGASIAFSSSGSSDSDGTIASYSWTFGDGNSSTLANPTHSYSSAGSYTVQLTVTDNLGATGVSSTSATVTDISGTGVLFSEVFYDTPGTDSQEEWIEIYNGTGSDVDLSSWTITDNNGTGSVYTFPANTTILDATYLTVAINSTGFNALYSFDADIYGSIPALNNTGDALLLKNDSGQTVDAVAWEGGASGGVPTGWGSTSSPTAPTGSSITRTNVTTDTDTFSDWSVASANGDPQVQPSANADPTAVINGPYTGTEGISIAMSSAGSSDSDGSIASYAWTFGDGNSSTLANPSHTYASAGSYTVSLTVTDNDGATNQAQTTATVDAVSSSSIKLAQGVLSGVSSSWQTVNLSETYTSMVVVASPLYDNTNLPAVTRIRNASGNSFEVKVQNPGNTALSGYTVHYMVMEEGVYTDAADGVKMEAVKFTSTTTDFKGSWSAQSQSYSNSYSSPVVLGQVMSENDSEWSVFWARGSSRTTAPNSSNLRVGKHVGEDSNTSRSNETIGYVIIESGSGTIDSTPFSAGLGSDIVKSVTNAPPYNYSISGLSTSESAIVSAAAMDGNDGGWPVLYGSGSVSLTSLSLAFDEDQISNNERSHTTEQVAYIVFGTPVMSKDVVSTDEAFVEIPEEISISQNYPNPFNPSTTIDFELNETANVTLSVYNMLGQEVARLVDGQRSAGVHTVTFDASNLSTGIYIYRLNAGGKSFTKKMLLAK